MKKPSIKTITVKNLINVLLLTAIVVLMIVGYNFRALTVTAIENQALVHADLVKLGLTSHMKVEGIGSREYFLEAIQHLEHINELKVIRGENVSSQFGAGNPAWGRTEPDSFVRQAFDSGEPMFVFNEFSWTPTIRTIIPYIASREGALDCLVCHNVNIGDVLGAVDIEMDVSEYRNHAVILLGGIFLLSFFALLLVLVNTSRTIRRYVQRPLEALVSDAERAYKNFQPVPVDQFNTREFASVANELNSLNAEIIAHQEQLDHKNEELIGLNDEIENTLRETVFTIGVIEAQRSKETANHTRRVSLYSELLARKFGLAEDQVDLIVIAAPLHDIGKLGVPESVLFKPGPLDEAERILMNNHPQIGYDMLKHSRRDILIAAGTIAHQHHEKWDGTGYPRGLAGDEIHIFARIVTIADVFDALLSSRVYKESWPIEKVVEWMVEQRGKHFDPALMDIFVDNVDAFVAIYNRYPADENTLD